MKEHAQSIQSIQTMEERLCSMSLTYTKSPPGYFKSNVLSGSGRVNIYLDVKGNHHHGDSCTPKLYKNECECGKHSVDCNESIKMQLVLLDLREGLYTYYYYCSDCTIQCRIKSKYGMDLLFSTGFIDNGLVNRDCALYWIYKDKSSLSDTHNHHDIDDSSISYCSAHSHWRPSMHFLYPLSLHNRIRTLLLCIKAMRMKIPKYLTYIIINESLKQ